MGDAAQPGAAQQVRGPPRILLFTHDYIYVYAYVYIYIYTHPASPLLFASTVNRLMQPLVDRWNREHIGFKICNERICLFAWMDDLYIFASSREDLQKMVRQTCHVTRPVGLLLQPAKCLWATNLPDAEEMSITAAGTVVPRVPRSEGFAVLGTLVTMSRDPNPEWNHRISKTWRAFWANSRLLLKERVSLRRRLRVWSSCVASVFLWGLAALTLTLAMMHTIDVICQREMVAKIMHRRRRPAELWLERHVHTRKLAGRFLAECQILPMSTLSFKRKLS